MGSDPQYAKYPDLSLAQHIFTLTNPSSTQVSRDVSSQKLRDAIAEHEMAPLYHYLYHPTDGILNDSGEGTTRSSSTLDSRRPSRTSSKNAKLKGTASSNFSWDEQLYEKLKAQNKEELQSFQVEEEEAEEKAGEIEVQAARGKRADFWARVGDQVSFTWLSFMKFR